MRVQEDTSISESLIASDIDGDTLTFSVVKEPQNGVVSLETNGSFSYTPNPNFNGSDSFSYKVNDGKEYSLEQNVTITVVAVNDAPVPTFTTLTLQEDSNKTATLTASDADGNDSLTFSIVSQPRNATLSLESNGSFTYSPNHNFNGSDSFSYKVNDGTTNSIVQSVTVMIIAVNDASVPTFTTLTLQEDTNKTATLTASDIDNNASSFKFSIVTQPQHATINLETNGSFTYTPNPNFNGSDFFTYIVNDGVDDSVVQRVAVRVTDTYDPPTPTFTTLRVQEDTTKRATLTASAFDGNSSNLTFSVVTQPQHGTLNLETNGSFSYTPDRNFNGRDSFAYKVNDGIADSVAQSVAITVTAVNDLPQINTEFLNGISMDANATKIVYINISDPDGDSLTLLLKSNSSMITISNNSTNPILQADYTNKVFDFNITSSYNATGSARVTITLSDGDANVSRSFDVNIVEVFKSGESWKGLVYNTVTSPYTSRVWLDRNLGASRACIAKDDEDCFGDYYQWGREADGHKKNNSDTTTTQATSLRNVGDKFITSDVDDWTTQDSNGSTRSTYWGRTDGSSICPIGFRVPTIEELKAETIDPTGADRVNNGDDAFNSFLKIPISGYRTSSSGTIESISFSGSLWSMTNNNIWEYYVYFIPSNSGTSGIDPRSRGLSVRCIKD